MRIVTLLGLLLSASAFAGIDWKPYSDSAFMNAQKMGKRVVLGFHKKGCGTCSAQDMALEKAGIKDAKNVEFLVVQRKNADHKMVYEKYGFTARQWAAIILFDGKKEVARIQPGTTSGPSIKKLVGML